tara:strand:+ start:3936 stop:4982 length:1047 start_codon:yes stop_codon:yes gene_type:complete
MFPTTVLSRKARNGPVVIINNRFMPAVFSNHDAKDFYSFCGYRFELKSKGSLSQIFSRYESKNEAVLEDHISGTIPKVAGNYKGTTSEVIRKKELLLSYLESCEEQENEKDDSIKKTPFVRPTLEDLEHATPPFDYLFKNQKLIIVNNQVYNLHPRPKTSVLKINNHWYTIGSHIGDLDSFEQGIDAAIGNFVKASAFIKVKNENALRNKEIILDRKIESYSNIVPVVNGMYNFDVFGFDPELGLLVAYLPAFHEGYTKKSYQNKGSAVAIYLLEEKNLTNPEAARFFAQWENNSYVPAPKSSICCKASFNQVVNNEFQNRSVHPIRKVMAYIGTVADSILHEKRIHE